jgi:hypothetical protein
MERHVQVLFMVGVVAIVGLAAFVYYRWRQRERVRGIKEWVGAYLLERFGGPLDQLSVNCSDDSLWPVLVGFDNPRTGLRHRLQFSCPGSRSTFSLLSQEQEKLAPP